METRSAELYLEKKGGLIAHFLAFVAGFVDAVGYIVLFKIFTANMSGNSVGLGIYLEEGNWSEILHRGFPIPVFMAGVFAASILIEWSTRKGFRRILLFLYSLEAAFIGLFLLLGEEFYRDGAIRTDSLVQFYALTALPAFAMGIQTAALHRVGGLNVRTTFVTGMLTGFCRNLATWLFWVRDHYGFRNVRAILSASSRQLFFVHVLICGGIWIFYMAGAVVGTYALLSWGLRSLSIAMIVLAAAVAVSFISGLEVAEI